MCQCHDVAMDSVSQEGVNAKTRKSQKAAIISILNNIIY